MAAAAMINDYEQVRAAALAPGSSPGTRQWLKRLVGEGLYAWIMTRSVAQPHDRAPISMDYSSGIIAERNKRDAIVQLLASMTLRSLTEEIDVYIQ